MALGSLGSRVWRGAYLGGNKSPNFLNDSVNYLLLAVHLLGRTRRGLSLRTAKAVLHLHGSFLGGNEEIGK